MMNKAFTLDQNPISIRFILDNKFVAPVPFNKFKLSFKLDDACQMNDVNFN